MQVDSCAQCARMLENHRKVFVREPIDIARESWTIFPDLSSTRKVNRLEVVRRLQIGHAYLLSLIDFAPSSAT